MNRAALVESIKTKRTFLCIGLDPDLEKLPEHLPKNAQGILIFNKAIIDATRDLCVAYKPNTAFYEVLGADGWKALEETVKYIGKDHLIIADAKRGDIGNSSKMYAKAIFETLGADAVTISPYMGNDSAKPFLDYEDKWTVFLALTSNLGAEDIQTRDMNALLSIGSEGIQNRQRWMQIFEHVAYEIKDWATPENSMLVVGATRADRFEKIRNIVPNHFLLVPGVGAQGGDFDSVVKYGMNEDCGILINSSRSIIFASSDENFATKAREKAIGMQALMNKALKDYKL